MNPPSTDRRRFDVRRCLGAGGFGEVYLASMSSAGGVVSEVALKVLHQGLDPRSQAIQRLKDEARLLGMLNHPAILRIHDLVLLEDRVTLVTEFVDGADLDQCLAGADPIPMPAVVEVIGKVADALQAAFGQAGPDGRPLHLMHRDIKPSNIRIGKHGEVKLLDFGIAKAAGFDREAKTQTNAVVGSFPYMAPERYDQSGDSTASDVYSLGCVLYEAIAGERLHHDLEVRQLFSLAMVQDKHDAAVTQRLELAAHVPTELFQLLKELLSYEPEGRPAVATLGARCEDLADELSGAKLARWCRRHAWPEIADEAGALSGRSITEASISRTASLLTDSREQQLPPREPEAAAPPPAADVSRLVAREVRSRPPEAAPTPVAAPAPAPTPAPVPSAPPPAAVPHAPRSNQQGSGRGLLLLGGLAVALALFVVGSLALGGGTLAALTWGSGTEAEAVVTDRTEAEPVAALDPEPGEAPVPDDVDPAPTALPGTASLPTDVPEADGVAAVEAVEAAPAPSRDCGDPVALEPAAMLGKLQQAQRDCLGAAMRDSGRSQTERGKLGRVLLVDGATRCGAGSGCSGWEADQRTYFEEVDRSDPDMLYKWSAYLFRTRADTDPQLQEVLVWVDRTLEVKSGWRGVDYVKRVDGLLEMGAKAAYKRFEAQPKNETLRGAAKQRSLAWLNNRVQLGKDYTDALQICASTAGSEEVCRKQMYEAKAQATVTFVSIPVGATVTIDGKMEGDAPLVVQLSYGEHEVVLKSGEVQGTQKITVGSDGATRWTWRTREDRWESSL